MLPANSFAAPFTNLQHTTLSKRAALALAPAALCACVCVCWRARARGGGGGGGGGREGRGDKERRGWGWAHHGGRCFCRRHVIGLSRRFDILLPMRPPPMAAANVLLKVLQNLQDQIARPHTSLDKTKAGRESVS